MDGLYLSWHNVYTLDDGSQANRDVPRSRYRTSRPRTPTPPYYSLNSSRCFIVEISIVSDYLIYESIHMQHTVSELCRRIETSWDALYRPEQGDFSIHIEGLYSYDEQLWLDLDKTIEFYFGKQCYRSEELKDAIFLLAEGTTTPTSLEGSQRQVQLPQEENGSQGQDDDFGIVPLSDDHNQQRQAQGTPQEQADVDLPKLSDQKPLFWISQIACLWKVDSLLAKNMVLLGRALIILCMLTYLFYIIWNPRLKLFWSNFDDNVGHSYYVIEASYFLLMYIVALRTFSKRHVERLFEERPQTYMGLTHQWPENCWFVTKCAVVGILVIILPAVVLIPALTIHDCRSAISIEDKGIVNTTVPVEFLGYFCFSLINLPLFLYIITLVRIHTTAIDSYKEWLLNCNASIQTAQESFRRIQRRLKESSEVLHWMFSLIFLFLLIWISVSMWYAVHRWEREINPSLFHVNSTGCHFPPAASRSSLITLTQLVCFYGYPLYFISKIPQRIRVLVEEVHLCPCEPERQILIKSEDVKEDILAVLQSGLTVVPRFMVFRRIDISGLSTIVLLLLTPLLTIVWNGITHP